MVFPARGTILSLAAVVVGWAASVAAGAGWNSAERQALFPPVKGIRSETFTYKKTPQGELRMYVFYPKDWKPTDRRAAIVFFFGGGWTGGSVEQFNPQAWYLAGRGMVAARADYRVRSRQHTTPVEAVRDALSAVRWLRAHAGKLGIDPNRICASGGSAGGHLAACTAVVRGLDEPGEDTKVSARPNLLVLYNPVLDTTTPAIARRIGSADKARQISPNANLTKDTPPSILYFGSKDHFLEGGRAYMKKATALGLDATLYVAPGVAHGFFNRSPWLQRTMYLTDEFLRGHGYLKGPATVKLPDGQVGLEKLRPGRTDRTAPQEGG